MKISLLILILAAGLSQASEVRWARFSGKVKEVDLKEKKITIQNKEGDLIGVKVDADVVIEEGKATKGLQDIGIDDKVTLYYLPKPASQDPADTPVGGFYPPVKKN